VFLVFLLNKVFSFPFNEMFILGLSETMSCIALNCRGLENLPTVSAFKNLLQDKDHTYVFISKTDKRNFEMNNFQSVQTLSGVVVVSC